MITDTAFDKLLAIYEHDRILWAAVSAAMNLSGLEFCDARRALRSLSCAHGIDPDA